MREQWGKRRERWEVGEGGEQLSKDLCSSLNVIAYD